MDDCVNVSSFPVMIDLLAFYLSCDIYVLLFVFCFVSLSSPPVTVVVILNSCYNVMAKFRLLVSPPFMFLHFVL